MSSIHIEIPHAVDRLEPVVGRLRLLAEYLEHPGVNQFDAASELLDDCANTVEAVLTDAQRANAEICGKSGRNGKVEVVRHV